MNKLVVVFVLLALVAAVASAAKDLDFALEYRGQCSYNSQQSTANCHLKAQSQEILTRIKGDGNVTLSVRKLIGSVSTLDVSVNYDFNALTWTSKGVLSFGVHQTADTHKIEFVNAGLGSIVTVPTSGYGFGSTWKVTRGFGAFDKASGLITFSGLFDFNSSGVTAGVVGIIFYDK